MSESEKTQVSDLLGALIRSVEAAREDRRRRVAASSAEADQLRNLTEPTRETER
jgi:hypothetical protein